MKKDKRNTCMSLRLYVIEIKDKTQLHQIKGGEVIGTEDFRTAVIGTEDYRK